MVRRADPALITQAFFERPVLEVAPDLLGCLVECNGVRIRLTEVEAYDGANDPGSHAYRGRTPRTRTMFGPPGGLYVYFTYGMHHCCNLVCGPTGVASAVLLRAGQVIEGADLARERRGAPSRTFPDRDLARGPARLAKALDLSRADDALNVVDSASRFAISRRVKAPEGIEAGPRVGVSGPGGDGQTFPWRFWIAGDPTVSAYRPAKPHGRSRRA